VEVAMRREWTVTRILNQLGEGAAFGALIGLILWMPHLF
jgi:hypothetical protein